MFKTAIDIITSHAEFFLGFSIMFGIACAGVGYLCWVNPGLKWKKVKDG